MIRLATAADLRDVAALWNGVIRDTTATFTSEEKTHAGLQALLAARPQSFLVAGQADAEGFMTWGSFRDGPGYARTVEHTIIVGPKGQGIGRSLMEHGLAEAAAQGHHVMVAAISGDNKVAQGFHATMGFDHAGTVPQVGRKAGQWLDLILMSKLLNAP